MTTTRNSPTTYPPAGPAEGQALWYQRFRLAAYVNAGGSLLWTVLIVLPFPPFSYLQPIVVGGGAGVWFVMAYLLLIVVGVCGFGWLSNTLYILEVNEGRGLDGRLMLLGFSLLEVGVAATSLLLGVAGVMGGYASTLDGASAEAVHHLLAPFVAPTSIATLIAVGGSAGVIVGMARSTGS